MEKLTKEELENYRNTYDKFDGVESNVFEKICNELIEYKSLEEELDIDLPTLFKALKQDYIYYKHYYAWGNEFKIYKEYITGLKCIDDNTIALWVGEYSGKEHIAYLKDYGKTWALRKEYLEYEKED